MRWLVKSDPAAALAALAADVRQLTDRAAVASLADRYLRSLDEGDFDAVKARAIFTKDVALSFPPGDHAGIAWIAEYTHGFMRHWERTLHNVSHYLIEVDGDQATIAWNVFAVHVHHGSPPPPAHSDHFYLGGRFTGTAVRTYSGWRLRRLTLRVAWTAGPSIPSIAAVMAGAAKASLPSPGSSECPGGRSKEKEDRKMEITSPERQREIIDIVYNKGLNDGDLTVADQYLTPDYQSHGSYDDSIRGPASFKLTIAMQHRSFSDVRYEVQDIVTEGDKSAVRWVMRGRHTGTFIGIPATGKEIEHNAMLILRFEGDRIAERWGIVDNFTLIRELQGAAPGPLIAVGGPPGAHGPLASRPQPAASE
jgi:predicted ester cyclase